MQNYISKKKIVGMGSHLKPRPLGNPILEEDGLYVQQDEYANYNDFRIDVRDGSPNNKGNITCSGTLQLLASKLLELIGLKHIYEMKLVHHHSFKLLGLISQEMKALDQKMVNTLCEALWEATARGNVEFFVSVLQMVPELIWHQNEKGSTIFMHAIEFRQPKIFSLIHGFGSKQAMATETDNFGNNMLHVAGLLAPSNQLNRIQGAALQMQRELQWFKEVERIMSPDRLENKNNESKTPRESFTENHCVLMKAAEAWMKGTATSCTVVGALIVTVMFAVAFTVPGGNNQDGILTSRYAEEDFLKSLPTKMIIGLSTLLLSLATMTIAFCVALLIMFRRELWVKNSVIVLACLPTLLFIWMQFPLLFDMFISTYGPSIFYRKIERWLIS
ncbi:Ankyrin repeat-containing protein [Parasponia andersonii]|uniref:Ankyrin repeat-containing protein n=1 Tax=Parasponia andersonii TaxID=3476 RepID=A0A2P5DCZ3_PARAD|nr:Ankyrin repeat-containing protein [Parasponia andersonii]